MTISPIRILLLLASVLAGGLAWLWFDQDGQIRDLAWHPPVAIQPEVKNPVAAKAAASGAAASYAVVLERPLFAPDRRPPPPPAPPPPPDPLADVRIQGIFTGETAGILARIDGKVRRLKLNDTVGPWTLKSIDGRDITFAQGDQTRQMRLAYAKLNTPVAAPAPVKPPPGAAAPQTGGTAAQIEQDKTRDRVRRLNEARASHGQPLLNYP